VEDRGVIARNSVGQELIVAAKHARAFEVYERRAIEVAAGDRLLLTANRCEKGFRATNGELVTVSGVEESGQVRLDDGRTIPAGFRQFAHGYAVTAHRSQGKSVDSVIISADGMRKELFYVAASRGRQSVCIVTSDKEQLRDSVARSSARKSASELARKAQSVLQRGEQRGMSLARRLARRAAIAPQDSMPSEMNYQYKPAKERPHERSFGR